MGELGKLDLDRLGGKRTSLGQLIQEDRPCGECGYNLKGLRFGGTCPECGTPIALHRRKKRDPDMGDSPIGYLRALSAGFQLMGAAGIVWIAWLILGSRFSTSTLTLLATGSLVYTGWFCGVLLALRERPFARRRREEKAGPPEWFALRLSILITQAFGFVALGAIVANVGGGSMFWAIVAMAALLIVMGGWPGLAIYLSRLAWWAGDDQLSVRLTALGFWLGALGAAWVFLGVMPASIVTPLGKFASIPIFLVYAALTVLMMIIILRMSTTVRWAQINARNVRARDRRMAQRAKEVAERARAEREAEIAAGGGTAMSSDQEALLAEIERKHREMAAREAEQGDAVPPEPMPGRQHVVESGDNVETFGLEEEGERGAGPTERA